jgi:DNA-binding MarR family transcriptional regulator
LPDLTIGGKYVNMTDIISDDTPSRRTKTATGSHLLGGNAAAVVAFPQPMTLEARNRLLASVELLFFAYRDFTGDADAALEEFGFGRAHHRVMHFVARHPGLCVADLLVILRITKQSLARVLKQLVDEGYISQKAGDEDRRERRLYLTVQGNRLAEKLTQLQVKRISEALVKIGPDAEKSVRAFLLAMISPEEQTHVERLIKEAETKSRSAMKGRQK